MQSYGMDNSDRGFCDVCSWELSGCICAKIRKCNTCGYSLIGSMKQFKKHSCIEVLQAELVECKRDSERLDWLEKQGWPLNRKLDRIFFEAEALRQAIDAAMSAREDKPNE